MKTWNNARIALSWPTHFSINDNENVDSIHLLLFIGPALTRALKDAK